MMLGFGFWSIWLVWFLVGFALFCWLFALGLLVGYCLGVFGCYLRCVVLDVDFTALVWIALLWVLLIVLAYSFVV